MTNQHFLFQAYGITYVFVIIVTICTYPVTYAAQLSNILEENEATSNVSKRTSDQLRQRPIVI
jgi:hypothetical protein